METAGTSTDSKALARHLRKWEALKEFVKDHGFVVKFNAYDRFMIRSIKHPENTAEHLATIEEVYAWIHGYSMGSRTS